MGAEIARALASPAGSERDIPAMFNPDLSFASPFVARPMSAVSSGFTGMNGTVAPAWLSCAVASTSSACPYRLLAWAQDSSVSALNWASAHWQRISASVISVKRW